MSRLCNWEWGESTVRNFGVAAGLSEGQAARWAFKLFTAKEIENTSRAATKQN